MFQKRNDLEVVSLLQKESNHLRSIAKELSFPVSTLMRTLHFLVEENVLDYEEHGRNKTYFLKESPERDIYEYMAEKYKKLKIIQNPLIRKIINKIISETKNCEMVILFGSYAKGKEAIKSDIDIYVETNDKLLKDRIATISEKLSVKIGKLDRSSILTREIIKNHIIIQNIERYFHLIR